jgi:hypothetical protein
MNKNHLVPVLVGAALLLFPVFISIQLMSLYQRAGQSFSVLLENINNTEVLSRLTEAVRPKVNAPHFLSQNRRAILLVKADNFPRTNTRASKIGCPPEAGVEGPIVSLDCISVVVFSIHRKPSLSELQRVAKDLELVERLQVLGGRVRGRSKETDEQPLVWFSHVIVQTPEYEALFVYPATYLDEQYNFRIRPWFQREVILDKMLLSPLYHEYVYKSPVITATRFLSKGGENVQVGVDISMPTPAPSPSIFMFNFLFASLALYLYWRAYQNLNMKFIVPLIASTSLLSVAYLFLSLGSILTTAGFSGISLPKLIAGASFIPSGSFLFLSGALLKGRRKLEYSPRFLALILCEICCAGVDLLIGERVVSAVFGACSLIYFGFCVLESRVRYSASRVEKVTPNPSVLGVLVFLAYSFWGGCQLVAAMISFGWGFISRMPLGDFGEIILDASTPFILLLYAKGLALFLTLLFLSALDRLRLLRATTLQKLGRIHIDERGAVVSCSGLPRSFPNDLSGKSVFSFLEDPIDQAEVRLALEKRINIQNYFCRFGPRDERRLLGLSLTFSEDEDVATLIFEHKDSWEDSVFAALLPVLRRDLVDLRQRLGQSRITAELEPSQDANSVQKEIAGDLQLFEEEFVALTGIASDNEPMRLKATIALTEIAGEVEAFTRRLFLNSSQHHEVPAVPKVLDSALLRIPPKIYSLVIHCIFSELLRKFEPRTVSHIRVGAFYTSGALIPGADDFLEIWVETPSIPSIEQEGLEGYGARPGGVRPSLARKGGLPLAAYLLNLFNGALLVHSQSESITAIRILVRILYSTIEETWNA